MTSWPRQHCSWWRITTIFAAGRCKVLLCYFWMLETLLVWIFLSIAEVILSSNVIFEAEVSRIIVPVYKHVHDVMNLGFTRRSIPCSAVSCKYCKEETRHRWLTNTEVVITEPPNGHSRFCFLATGINWPSAYVDYCCKYVLKLCDANVHIHYFKCMLAISPTTMFDQLNYYHHCHCYVFAAFTHPSVIYNH